MLCLRKVTHSLTRSPTHSLTHSPTHSLTHSPTYSLTHSFTYSLIYSHIYFLTHAGIYVIGFSYPVVPKGAARIRVQLSAAHSPEQVQKAIDAFVEVGRAKNVIK